MMYLRDAERDQPLLHELQEEEVVTNAMFGSFDLPHEGLLMDGLRMNAARIDEGRWCEWLIRRHRCIRVKNTVPDYFFLAEIKFGHEDALQSLRYDAFPFTLHGSQLLVGCARPLDLSAQNWVRSIEERAGAIRSTFLALTLSESIFIRSTLNDRFKN